MKNRGFTLIELLVVIAIIAILAAILFPVFMNAREKARQTACISNMNQLSKAFRMYLDDSNGQYPLLGNLDVFAKQGENNPGGAWIWFDGRWVDTGGFHYNNPNVPWGWKANPAKGSIWKYTNRTRNLFVCPSDKHSRLRNWTRYGGFGLSYTVNNNIGSADYGDTLSSNSPAMESDIVRPTKTVLMADQGDGSLTTHPPVVTAMKAAGLPPRTPCYDGNWRWWEHGPSPVHCGGENWVFCDGHVRWLNLRAWKALIFYRNGQPTDPRMFTNSMGED